MVSITPSYDPLAPNAASSSRHTFKTLERERLNRHPSTNGVDHPALEELVKPHVESFNALMEDSSASLEDGQGKGLLQLGVEEIGSKVIFDGKGDENGSLGNKISCEYGTCFLGLVGRAIL